MQCHVGSPEDLELGSKETLVYSIESSGLRAWKHLMLANHLVVNDQKSSIKFAFGLFIMNFFQSGFPLRCILSISLRNPPTQS